MGKLEEDESYFNSISLYNVADSAPSLVIRMFLFSWSREGSYHIRLPSTLGKKKWRSECLLAPIVFHMPLTQNNQYAKGADLEAARPEVLH